MVAALCFKETKGDNIEIRNIGREHNKYGTRVPKTVKEVLQIDKEEGNTMWADAIEKEIKKIRPSFQLYSGDTKDLIYF